MTIPFRVTPTFSPRIWGGTRLGDGEAGPIGESWITGPQARVASGRDAGCTLADLAVREGEPLLGRRAPRHDHFPLLVKLIDAADWLSVQVHPDDVLAQDLEGPGAIGKTEAWYVIEAAPDAAILLGARPDASPEAVRAAVAQGGVVRLLERRAVAAGDAYLVPAGTLHAIGPGLLLYEVQQPSDLTYRVDDWGRPSTHERGLHTRQALQCVVPEARPVVARHESVPGESVTLAACDHFVLEQLEPAPEQPVRRDPGGASLHLLTAVGGGAVVSGDGWHERLAPLESLVVPASCGPYEVAVGAGDEKDGRTPPGYRVLLARLPDTT
jgi:mannose-6-phosphate isomerase